MNYRFISTAQRMDKVDTSAAAVVTDIDEILAANKKIGEYKFNEDAKVTERLRNAEKIAIVRNVSSNGLVNYRANVVLSEDNIIVCRLYGAGKGKPYAEREYTPEEIKKAVFGFCKSDGEIVNELKFDGVKAKKVPVIYLQTA